MNEEVQDITFEDLYAHILSCLDCHDEESNDHKHDAMYHHKTARCNVLHLGYAIGSLCSKILEHAPMDPNGMTAQSEANEFWLQPSKERSEIHQAIADIFQSILFFAHVTEINLESAILKKMELNARKYPVELCKGKAGKYTKYSKETGITTNNQSMLDISVESDASSNGANVAHSKETPRSLQLKIRQFALDRKWNKYHSPRNIVLAMMGECGELAELFQWLGDIQDNEIFKSIEDRDHCEQEIADVSIYCLRLADVTGIQDIGILIKY